MHSFCDDSTLCFSFYSRLVVIVHMPLVNIRLRLNTAIKMLQSFFDVIPCLAWRAPKEKIVANHLTFAR